MSYVEKTLADRQGPFIAATDYMKIVSDQIRQWVPGRYVVLGTDGFGRSDGARRAALALRGRRASRSRSPRCSALAEDGGVDRKTRRRRDRAARHRSREAQPGDPVTPFFFDSPVDVVVPDLGDFADVEIIEILVKPGDEVAAEQGLDHARDREGDDGRAVARGRGASASSR